MPQYDIILCRNVLIYFNVDIKQAILEKMYNVMAPDGFLMLGGAETVVGVCDKFAVDQRDRTVFRTDKHAAEAKQALSA